MKKNRILNAMNYISDEKITNADEPVNKKSAAASALIIIGACAAEAAAVMLISSIILNSGIIGGNVSVSNESEAYISADESVMSSAASDNETGSKPYDEVGDSSTPDSIGCESSSPEDGSETSSESDKPVLKGGYRCLIDYDKLPFEYDPEKALPYPEEIISYVLWQGDSEPYNISQISPLDKDSKIDTLPVFRSYKQKLFKFDEVLPLLNRIAEAAGAPLTDISMATNHDDYDFWYDMFGEKSSEMLMEMNAKAGDVSIVITTENGLIVSTSDNGIEIVFDALNYGTNSDIYLNRILNSDYRSVNSGNEIEDKLSVMECIGMYEPATPQEALDKVRSGYCGSGPWAADPILVGEDEEITEVGLYYEQHYPDWSEDDEESKKKGVYWYEIPYYEIVTVDGSGSRNVYNIPAIIKD